MKPALLAFALAIFATSAHAQTPGITPEQIGQIFCIGSIANDMAPVEALLELSASYRVARLRETNAQYEAQFPGDKPPLGDGLPWRSQQDHADGCEASVLKNIRGMAHVEIEYRFLDTPEASYSDVLVLGVVPTAAPFVEGVPEAWRIIDIMKADNGRFLADVENMNEQAFEDVRARSLADRLGTARHETRDKAKTRQSEFGSNCMHPLHN